jgi:hypothetical protein
MQMDHHLKYGVQPHFWSFTLFLGLFLIPSPSLCAASQSDQPAGKRVYTNDDLSAGEEPSPVLRDSKPVQKKAKTVRPAPGKDQAGNGKEDWQRRSRALHSRLDQLNAEIGSLEKQRTGVTGPHAVEFTPNGSLHVDSEEQAGSRKLNRLKSQRDGVIRAIQNLEDAAHKANVPPGWLR